MSALRTGLGAGFGATWGVILAIGSALTLVVIGVFVVFWIMLAPVAHRVGPSGPAVVPSNGVCLDVPAPGWCQEDYSGQ